MRLFVAIDIPDDLKRTLAAMQTGLQGVKWVDAAQMHLTMRFIGDVDDTTLDALKRHFAKIKFSPFNISLKDVGKFPAKGKPRVLWVGVSAPEILGQLATAIETMVVACGLPDADKPFSPHITLGRVKSAPPRSIMDRYFADNKGFESPSFTVSSFVLYSSDLQPTGAVYTPEAVFTATH